MRRILITFILILSYSTLLAQKQDTDTTIYNNYRLKTDTQTRFAEGPQVLLDAIPEFPGGIKRYNKFLYKNLKWPDKSGIVDVQGKVFLQFVVEKDGHLSSFRVARSLQPEFDAEAVRVMKLSPKWKPAIYKGNPVRVSYYMPVSFILSN